MPKPLPLGATAMTAASGGNRSRSCWGPAGQQACERQRSQTLGAATRAVARRLRYDGEGKAADKMAAAQCIGSGLCQSNDHHSRCPCSDFSDPCPLQALTRQLSPKVRAFFKMRFPCWKPPAPLLHRPRRKPLPPLRPRRKRCSRLRPPKRLRRSRRRCQRRSRRPRW